VTDTRPPGWSLDAGPLVEEVNQLTKVVSMSIAPADLQQILGEARSHLIRPLPDRSLVGLALLADCLRLIKTTMDADGRISDEEVVACLPLLATIGRQFASAVPGYDQLEPVSRPVHGRILLAHYAVDTGVFGFRGSLTEWAGLDLCRQTAVTGDGEAVELYERIALRLFDEVAAPGGLNEQEHLARLALQQSLAERAGEGYHPRLDVDRRERVFLASDLVIFGSVAHAHLMSERDPFDVEDVHAEARDAFARTLDRATDPAGGEAGRMLLVLGDSGSGKTHLLRALRSSLHGRRRGLAAYVQLHSRREDYSRSLNLALIEALDQPYDAPEDQRSGLLHLSNGIADLVAGRCGARVDRLRSEGDESVRRFEGADRAGEVELIDELVDEVLLEPGFDSFEPDLLRALLHLQRRDPRISARVLTYLSCRDMNDRDCRYLGGVVPRTGPEDPGFMIAQLARLIWLTQGGALVFLVDQVEDQPNGENGPLSFRRAIDALCRTTHEIPSAIGVLACQDGAYQAAKPHLQPLARDRLERDPSVQRLGSARSFEEIEAVVSRRLEVLYAETDARYRSEEPVHPVPVPLLRDLENRRLRDVLDTCHRFREACKAEGRIVPADRIDVETDRVLDDGPDPLLELDRAWSDIRATWGEVPDTDDQLIELLGAAARLVARELAPAHRVDRRIEGITLQVAVANRPPQVIGFANKGFQGGGFKRQVAAIRSAAGRAQPVVARLSEFPTGKGSTETVSDLRRGGGRSVVVRQSDLRAVLAAGSLVGDGGPQAREWLISRRPVSSLSSIRALFDLDPVLDGRLTSAPAGRLGGLAPGAVGPVGSVSPAGPIGGDEATRSGAPGEAGDSAEEIDGSAPEAPVEPAGDPEAPGAGGAGLPDGGEPVSDGGEPVSDGGVPVPERTRGTARSRGGDTLPRLPLSHSQPIQLGRVDSLAGEPSELSVDALTRHCAILGAPGSGKTTAALGVVEQLLERDVPVVLVDRKGDLAGYAVDDWWSQPGACRSSTARKWALAERVDVRLFTPGSVGGRSLSLPAVPVLDDLPPHERETALRHATVAFSDLLGLSATSPLRSVLLVAISLLARTGGRTGLTPLVELIDRRDDALVAEVPHFDDRHFEKLVELLESVRIDNDHLFTTRGDVLSSEVLLSPDPSGRVPLSIVSTRFLGDHLVVQLWVSRLIGELAQLSARSPSDRLQAAVLFDEADVYLPAGTQKPPTKEPMLDLLRRARSSGLGIILAAQSPGDFDYQARDLITTWLVGRVGDRRSVDKMRPLFEQRGALIGPKLARLGPGQFYLMGEGGVEAVRIDRSLLEATPLGATTILELAEQCRSR
jgi:molybdopterin-guanine dinucleotide biosynthesis protein